MQRCVRLVNGGGIGGRETSVTTCVTKALASRKGMRLEKES